MYYYFKITFYAFFGTIWLLLHYSTAVLAVGITIDIEQEHQWKKVLSSSVKSGQIIELKTENLSFIGIYQQQNLLKKHGSVILLHDKAGHPNWKDVIKPLRIELSNHGWDTLSIQMPLEKDSLTSAQMDAFYQLGISRINSAIAYLIAHKERNIFLLAYGSNAMVAVNFANHNQHSRVNNIKAIVLVSPEFDKSLTHLTENIKMLEKVKFPILDIYGSNDFYSVTSTASQRKAAAKRGGNKYYRQQQIFYADHFFTNQSEVLIKRTYSWMLSINQQ